jgi:hypothetical protein
VLSLLLQLANQLEVDLEAAYRAELQIMEKRFAAADWQRYSRTYARKAGHRALRSTARKRS